MNNATEVLFGAMIYKPSFIKIDSGFQKLTKGIHIQTHRQEGL
jgi:hypothetical protein